MEQLQELEGTPGASHANDGKDPTALSGQKKELMRAVGKNRSFIKALDEGGKQKSTYELKMATNKEDIAALIR